MKFKPEDFDFIASADVRDLLAERANDIHVSWLDNAPTVFLGPGGWSEDVEYPTRKAKLVCNEALEIDSQLQAYNEYAQKNPPKKTDLEALKKKIKRAKED